MEDTFEETISYKQDGVLYEKDVMVVELRKDGKLELMIWI